MPRIPIIGPMQSGVDETAIAQGAVTIVDAFIDEAGALVKRPGLFCIANVGAEAPVTGVFWWREKQILVVVCGKRIFAMRDFSTTPTFDEITPTSSTLYPSLTLTTIFAATERWLYMTSGGKVIAWNGDVTSPAVDAAAPTSRSSHLAYLDGYVICNSVDSQTFYYTNLLPETAVTPAIWNPVGINAEGSPDDLFALKVGWRELMLFGFGSTEIWYNSGADVPLSRLEGSFIEQGCIAKYSPAMVDNTWFWLNQERQVIRLAGRSPQVVSQPVERYLNNFARVDDAIGTVLDNFYVLSFPYADYCLAFNLKTQSWSVFAKWEPEKAVYNRFLGQTAVFVPEWNVWVVAGRTGLVYVWDKSLMTDNGELIRPCYRSAHFDHGTLHRKRSKRMYLRVKRGS